MQSNEKKKDVKDPEDIPEDIPLMNEDEFSLVSLFSFLESDNKITMESIGVLEEPAIPTTFHNSLNNGLLPITIYY